MTYLSQDQDGSGGQKTGSEDKSFIRALTICALDQIISGLCERQLHRFTYVYSENT
jgi:hypothetical protein